MTTPYQSPDYDTDAADYGREAIRTEYKFSHVTTGRYLPTPGKAPAWPFADIGSWMIDANASAGDWLEELKDWRREHLVRIGYTDVNYRRPELQWAQRNFVHAQMMVEDRYFFDAATGQYTVDRYLDDLTARFGGLDSVLIWYIYPNIGIDDRNQFDLAHDMPGGLAGLKTAVQAFQKRGVKVFLPAKPWDHGTRDPGVTHWDGLAEIVKAVGADGINGDTFNGVPRAFFDACDARGNPVVVQPESTISSEEQLIWNVQSWGKRRPMARCRRCPSGSGWSPAIWSTTRTAGVETVITTCSTASSTASATTPGRTSGASGTSSPRATVKRCAGSPRCTGSSRSWWSRWTGSRTRSACRAASSPAGSRARG
ncbi:hypothetical protein QT383_10385 [Stenotrophomonas rhizophila]